MKNVIQLTLEVRKRFHAVLSNTPKEELLKIPEGFNNNIWWNIAHVVVTQQLLVYNLSNLPMNVSDALVSKYKKGTTPDGTATDEEIALVKELLFSTIEKTMEDYENGVFESFNEYTTSAKVTLKSVADSMPFSLFHEGLHMGAITALKKKI